MLTFSELDAKIEALPEGPAAVLRAPKWSKYWTFLGLCGTFLGLLPSLLIIWLEPQYWMVIVSRVGLILMVLGFAPGFLRNVWVTAQEFRRFRRGFIEQFEHDVDQFERLVEWLATYPLDVLERQSRYAKMGSERASGRLVTLLGGVERLGLLPLLLSAFVVLRSWQDLLSLPPWLGLLAFMAAFLWGIGWALAQFRRRLQLYAFLLDEAILARKYAVAIESDGMRQA